MRRLLAALIVGIAAGCGSDPAGPTTDEIWMQNSTFTPTTKTVGAGAIVTWTNKDGIQHNVTSSSVPPGAGAFGGIAAGNGSFQTTLTVSGSYQYFCSLHGTASSGMRGTISVVVN